MKNLVLNVNIVIWVKCVIWAGWCIFKKDRRFNRTGSILIAAFYCLMITTFSIVCFRNINWPVETIGRERAVVSITTRVVSIGIANLLIKRSFFRILFYMTLLDGLRDFFLYYESLIVHNIRGISFQSVLWYLSIVVILCFTLYCVYRFTQYFENSIAEYETIKEANIWKYLWMIPAFLSIVFRVSTAQRYYDSRYSFTIENFLFVFLWYSGSLACYYTITRIVYELNRIIKAEHDLNIEKVKTKALQERNEIFIADEKKMRCLRHDIRHHMRIMEQMSENGEYDALTSYIHDYIKESALEEQTLLCENVSVDSIMGYYKSESEKNGIKVSINLNIPKIIGISDTHLTVILGNLMENALEACRRQESGEKFIEARMEIVKNSMLAVMIKNSYNGQLEKDNEGRYYSVKESNRKQIGTGIISVQSIIKKYNGIYEFSAKDRVFKSCILLNLKNEN
ncbi:GHKL domain-containing protein [Clostridium sp. AM58-1XD]|nr:GHKL domain-containing protein [Clostridium sp. AM58-1XD]